jgi:hypothetical protein
MPLSTATPEQLPDLATLRRLTKSIAMLDAIISPEWEDRYYSYNAKWGEGEEMASMRNGCGDDWFLLFDSHGAALKGFAHEFPLAGDVAFANHIQQVVPPEFASFLQEPAFGMDMASFCLWRRHVDRAWNVVAPVKGTVSADLDGSAELLGILDGHPETYQEWAEYYYERKFPLPAIRAIYSHQPLKEGLVTILNSTIALSDVAADALEIGYPIPFA